MSLVSVVRRHLDLSQSELGIFIAGELGRATPIHPHRISEYERQVVTMPNKIREILVPLALDSFDVTEISSEDLI